MAASEMAYGEGHPATYTEQPKPTHRRAQLSGFAFGEDESHGFSTPLALPQTHDYGPDY